MKQVTIVKEWPPPGGRSEAVAGQGGGKPARGSRNPGLWPAAIGRGTEPREDSPRVPKRPGQP